jgi:hypothetical protein
MKVTFLAEPVGQLQAAVRQDGWPRCGPLSARNGWPGCGPLSVRTGGRDAASLWLASQSPASMSVAATSPGFEYRPTAAHTWLAPHDTLFS